MGAAFLGLGCLGLPGPLTLLLPCSVQLESACDVTACRHGLWPYAKGPGIALLGAQCRRDRSIEDIGWQPS